MLNDAMHLDSSRLASRTTLGVGGPADHFAFVQSTDEVHEALRFARSKDLPVYPLGGGSNLVVSDAGVRGLVLALGTRGVEFETRGTDTLVHARAGENWDDLVAVSVERGLAGLECLSGIPGSVGATPIQNVGAYGQEVADCIESVEVLDRTTLEIRTLSNEECQFAYRDSFFKRDGADRFIVLGVSYRLRPQGEPRIAYAELKKALETRNTTPDLAEVRRTVIELRRGKSMVLDPNDENGRSCGSFFVNALIDAERLAAVRAAGFDPPSFAQADGRVKIPSAWLIERAGVAKGFRLGPAGISSKHCLALVAHDGARATDVIAVAHFVRARVLEAFGIELVPEPQFWGFDAWDRGLPLFETPS